YQLKKHSRNMKILLTSSTFIPCSYHEVHILKRKVGFDHPQCSKEVGCLSWANRKPVFLWVCLCKVHHQLEHLLFDDTKLLRTDGSTMIGLPDTNTTTVGSPLALRFIT